MKIFYSWQSDIENKFNRNFIKDCLELAIKKLNQDQNIEEAIRLDHDTKDIKGTPDITGTIFRKIEECDIFVGDISFIAKLRGKKFCPNPNVLIELGYALKALGDEKIVNVMNTAFGKPKNNLPFDLAHKRWPIQYGLNVKNYSNKAEVKNILVTSLYGALFPYINQRKNTHPLFPSNSERILHRENLRKEFDNELLEIKSKQLRTDAIIRDIDRIDGYPEVDESEGISAWFRLGLLETYTRGIRVGLRIGGLTECEEGFRFTNYKDGEESDITAYLIGEIPYDSIVTVNWEGDEYYSFPHIYCHFNHNAEPYERLYFGEKVDMGNGHNFYKEISDYETVRKNSENTNAKYFA